MKAPGRPVALAGPSSSGKTLVLLTLLRFLDLSAGQPADLHDRLSLIRAPAGPYPPEG
jgi:ABC-type transport system involved in Fe-S cluster assembly fused permease/ATPase subunit